MSKAKPAGHLTAAKRMVPASPARSHLKSEIAFCSFALNPSFKELPDYISAVSFSGKSEVFFGKTILAQLLR